MVKHLLSFSIKICENEFLGIGKGIFSFCSSYLFKRLVGGGVKWRIN